VRFEHRYASGRNERYPELANGLIDLKADVILTWGTDAALAAKRATTTTPIVMGAIGDPIAGGIVTNLARPEANVTGFSSLAPALEAKRLELLKGGASWIVSGRRTLQPHESVHAACDPERTTRCGNAARVAHLRRGPRHHDARCSVREVREGSARRVTGAGGNVPSEPAQPHRAV